MKFALGFFLFLSTLAFANENAPGFLVVTLLRNAETSETQWEKAEQSYKIPLNAEFMAQFKNLPSLNTSGTGFYIASRTHKIDNSNTFFMWWIRRLNDGKLYVNLWQSGAEEIDGKLVDGHNPGVGFDLHVPSWDAIHMSTQVSYAGPTHHRNFVLTIRYVAADDPILTAVPTAEILKADRTVLFPGERPQCEKLLVTGGFQEG